MGRVDGGGACEVDAVALMTISLFIPNPPNNLVLHMAPIALATIAAIAEPHGHFLVEPALVAIRLASCPAPIDTLGQMS